MNKHRPAVTLLPWKAGSASGAAALGASILALAALLTPRPAWAGAAPPVQAERIPIPAASAGKPAESGRTAKATFAGGCFWCMESPYGKLTGVRSVVSGYTGGQDPDPTYEEVSRGNTGHAEAVEVAYDPGAVSYATLLNAFWREIDPTDRGGQFADRGSQYRPAIFYHNAEQKRLAEASRDALAKSGRFRKPIVVEIAPAAAFHPAEEYHQGYCKKNPVRYQRYRKGSGREDFLTKTWGRDGEAKPVPVTEDNDGFEDGAAPSGSAAAGTGPAQAGKAEGKKEAGKMEPKPYRKPTEAELQKILTPTQYKITQQCGTERAFTGEYWDNKREGIYVDVASGEPLFSSRDKFDSGTGWPSFTRALEKGNVVEKTDRTLGMSRTEIRSKHGDSHLGHVFDDGPAPTGLRYCVNSASLRFIPKEKLAEEGYGQYLSLFDVR